MRMLLLSLVVFVGSALGAQTDPPQASLVFDPPVLEVVRDSSGYVQQMISMRSTTGDTIRLTSVNGSCRCATGTVQRPLAYDTIPAKIYIGINAQHFEDSVNYVDYTIGHTGSEGSSVFRVVVRIPEDQR